MKRTLHIQVKHKPHENAEQEQHELLEMIASVIADKLVDSARKESIGNSISESPVALRDECGHGDTRSYP